jgi:hypothetical protein
MVHKFGARFRHDVGRHHGDDLGCQRCEGVERPIHLGRPGGLGEEARVAVDAGPCSLFGAGAGAKPVVLMLAYCAASAPEWFSSARSTSDLSCSFRRSFDLGLAISQSRISTRRR